MLPHFIWQDFHDLLVDMRRAGCAFDDAWYAPHFEFSFPRYGAVDHAGIGLEVRQALEPWHVMGEEPSGGGTVRYVDSSVERLQVKLGNLTGERYVVTCNGQPVPLMSTGSPGEYVAGVRFRAWCPPACLHQTIGTQSPLIIDIVDSWSNRSIGGCTYYVAHPGGRNYDSFPVNANEAESRRLARFSAIGHTPGKVVPPALLHNPDFPATLDLRLSARAK